MPLCTGGLPGASKARSNAQSATPSRILGRRLSSFLRFGWVLGSTMPAALKAKDQGRAAHPGLAFVMRPRTQWSSTFRCRIPLGSMFFGKSLPRVRCAALGFGLQHWLSKSHSSSNTKNQNRTTMCFRRRRSLLSEADCRSGVSQRFSTFAEWPT